jgi:hypothetical protein
MESESHPSMWTVLFFIAALVGWVPRWHAIAVSAVQSFWAHVTQMIGAAHTKPPADPPKT